MAVNITLPRARGTNGTNGTNGVGVPAGGLAGQVLVKLSDASYDTAWVDYNPVPPSSGGALDFSLSLNSALIGAI